MTLGAAADASLPVTPVTLLLHIPVTLSCRILITQQIHQSIGHAALPAACCHTKNVWFASGQSLKA
jgi:hypothetical protein